MNKLVTITTKFYDKSGNRIINLNVQSRYKGSLKANSQKLISSVCLYFRLRQIELLRY